MSALDRHPRHTLHPRAARLRRAPLRAAPDRPIRARVAPTHRLRHHLTVAVRRALTRACRGLRQALTATQAPRRPHRIHRARAPPLLGRHNLPARWAARQPGLRAPLSLKRRKSPIKRGGGIASHPLGDPAPACATLGTQLSNSTVRSHTKMSLAGRRHAL